MGLPGKIDLTTNKTCTAANTGTGSRVSTGFNVTAESLLLSSVPLCSIRHV